LTQQKALEALSNVEKKDRFVRQIFEQRDFLKEAFESMNIEKVYPSDSNSLLIKVKGAHGIYNALVGKLIIVRDRSSVTLCNDCLRITVGTQEENELLIKELKVLL
jgi:histidinol-phosphate aminotransferase